MHRLSLPFERTSYLAFKTSWKFVPKYFQPELATELHNGIAIKFHSFQRFKPDSGQVMRCFRWNISIYTNKIELHRSRHCKNKRQQIFSYTYGGLVSRTSRNHDGIFSSGVSTANQITSLVGQNLADRPEFLRDLWSGPILASDDIREHMGEAKNGPDRRSGWLSWTLSLVGVVGGNYLYIGYNFQYKWLTLFHACVFLSLVSLLPFCSDLSS